jgi:hypothetical protein
LTNAIDCCNGEHGSRQQIAALHTRTWVRVEENDMAKEEKSGATMKHKPFMDIRFMRVRIQGDDPLIVHAWSKKAVMELLGKEMKVPKGGRPERDPEGDVADAKYYDRNGNEAILATAVKKAMISAISSVSDMKKTHMSQAFFVWGTEDKERAAILYLDGKNGQEGTMRADMISVRGQRGAKSADIRFRPEYAEWAIDVVVEYNALGISKEQILNLLNVAGYGVGIFEWRPEKGGTYGRFEVVEAEDLPGRPQWVKATGYLRKGEMDIKSILEALRSQKAVAGAAVIKKGKKKGKKTDETEVDTDDASDSE